ncbi:MAG: hypothetical protein LBQ46_04550 [Treponema sp.]|jgi:hypothetical protein|nr:hypothetical protein [Treponema sp.]
MNELEKKTGMTEAEADYWDEYYTNNPPKVNPAGNRIKMEPLTVVVEGIAAHYLKSTAEAEHKTPAEIINGMIRREMAAAL